MKQKKESGLFFKLPSCCHYVKQYWLNQIYPIIDDTMRKSKLSRLDPFALLPETLIYWYLVPPLKAIGVSINDLEKVAFYWRQQMEPNETVYVMFKVLQLRTPVPLTLFILLFSLGLVIVGEAYKIAKTISTEYERRVPIDESVTPSLSPFSLTPRMSIYTPIFNDHLSFGFLTIDLQHIQVSIKQSLEPNQNVRTLIRFIDLYSPYPIQVSVMLLIYGLYLTKLVFKYLNKLNQETANEVRHACYTCENNEGGFSNTP
jgi:hypothetical protein